MKNRIASYKYKKSKMNKALNEKSPSSSLRLNRILIHLLSVSQYETFNRDFFVLYILKSIKNIITGTSFCFYILK